MCAQRTHRAQSRRSISTLVAAGAACLALVACAGAPLRAATVSPGTEAPQTPALAAADILWEAESDAVSPPHRLELFVEFVAAAPDDPRAMDAVLEIFRLARGLPYQMSAAPLERLMEVLAVHPLRPRWQVRALQAAVIWDAMEVGNGFGQVTNPPSAPPGTQLAYIHVLEQILDETRPDEYYLRYRFATPFDEALLSHLGLTPPVVRGYDLPFLRAVSNPVKEEPVQAQILMELAARYQQLGMEPEARFALERYLKLYFPRYRSREVLERLRRFEERNYVDPSYIQLMEMMMGIETQLD